MRRKLGEMNAVIEHVVDNLPEGKHVAKSSKNISKIMSEKFSRFKKGWLSVI